jgi:hypothetical protein
MKVLLLIIISFVYSYSGDITRVKNFFEDDNIKCSYETIDGRLDGKYVSYYQCGKKRAEGSFESNCRTGMWTVWDTAGKIIVQRDYSDYLNFNSIIPKTLKKHEYTIQRNEHNYIDYFSINEEMILWSTRIWRTILEKENSLIFNDNKLFNVINNNLIEGNIVAYNPLDDDFRTALTPIPDTSLYSLIGYKIKEDYFFDNERFVIESRIIGICPFAINKENKDTVDLYWIYYPELRKYLAKELIVENGLPKKIKTLDDVFFYHYFYGQIDKQLNAKNIPISSYKKGEEIKKEADSIEINIIETEHSFWIQLSQNESFIKF